MLPSVVDIARGDELMPPSLAYAALLLVAGVVWRRFRPARVPPSTGEADGRAGEIFDTIPLERGADGIYRPRRRTPRA